MFEHKDDGMVESRKINFKCYQCRKLRHLKMNCRVKLKEGNVVDSNGSTEHEEWAKYFIIESSSTSALGSRSLETEWIVDFE